MADSSAPVNSAAPANAATTGDNALPKNPFAEVHNGKPSEPTSTGVTQPLSVTPDIHKPADTPAATANGGAAAPESSSSIGINGAGGKLESLVPEETKQVNAPAPVAAAPEAAADKPASSLGAPPAEASTNSNAGAADSASSAQPPLMTGALPESSAPKPSESAQHDGVSDVPVTTTAPEPAGLTQTDGIKDTPSASAPPTSVNPVSDATPPVLNGAEKKDAGIDKNAPATTLAGSAASTAAVSSAGPDEAQEKKAEEVVGKKDAPPAVADSTASGAASAEKQDVEMKDATPPVASDTPAVSSTAAPTTTSGLASDLAAEKPAEPAPTPIASAGTPAVAPVSDITGIASTTAAPATAAPAANPTAAGGEVSTGRKRKAETNTNGPVEAEEPTAKKRKGPLAKAVAKAKGVVDDMKEKRKSKKKEPAPVGRTERKTRSQGRVD